MCVQNTKKPIWFFFSFLTDKWENCPQTLIYSTNYGKTQLHWNFKSVFTEVYTGKLQILKVNSALQILMKTLRALQRTTTHSLFDRPQELILFFPFPFKKMLARSHGCSEAWRATLIGKLKASGQRTSYWAIFRSCNYWCVCFASRYVCLDQAMVNRTS